MPRSDSFNARVRGTSHIDFKTATTGVAAKAMRNEISRLVSTVEDTATKKASSPSFFLITPVAHLVYLGIRHGNAVLFLPLYPLSRRTRKERRPVRHHQPRPQLHLTIPLSSDWDRIKSPDDQIVPYADLPKPKDTSSLKKLAVLKVNGGLGTSMGMFLPCHPCCLSAHVDISQE